MSGPVTLEGIAAVLASVPKVPRARGRASRETLEAVPKAPALRVLVPALLQGGIVVDADESVPLGFIDIETDGKVQRHSLGGES